MKCANCHPQRKHCAQGLCRSCYEIIRTHRPKNKIKYKQYQKNYYAINKEKIICKSVDWIKNNRDQFNSNMRNRWKNNLELRKYTYKFRKKHPEYWKTENAKRSAKLTNALIGDPKEILTKIKFLMTKKFCAWCYSELAKTGIHIDHIIPLSRGGPHMKDNLCASCPKCNTSRGNKLIEEWLPNQTF